MAAQKLAEEQEIASIAGGLGLLGSTAFLVHAPLPPVGFVEVMTLPKPSLIAQKELLGQETSSDHPSPPVAHLKQNCYRQSLASTLHYRQLD